MLRRAALLSSPSLSSAGVVGGVIQDDWGRIIQICKAGRAKDFYPLGSYKPLELLNDAGTVNMVFSGVNKEIRADEQCLPTTTWISETYTSLQMDDLEAYLPMTIREAIVEVWKEWANAWGMPSNWAFAGPSCTSTPNRLSSSSFTVNLGGWKVYRTWLTSDFDIDSSIGLYREATSIKQITIHRQRRSSCSAVLNSSGRGYDTTEMPASGKASVCFCL